MNELEKMTNNLNELQSIKGELPDDFLLKVVAHPTIQKLLKKNNKSLIFNNVSFSSGWSLTSARISQNQAMKYVNIARLSDFKYWAGFNEVPYAQVGNRKFFRIEELDKAMLRDEQETKNLVQTK